MHWIWLALCDTYSHDASSTNTDGAALPVSNPLPWRVNVTCPEGDILEGETPVTWGFSAGLYVKASNNADVSSLTLT